MAQIVSVRLSRADASPWGFRLQGGKDFCQPLLIQKVNGGSLAEKAGLQVGDALIKVNNTEVFSLRHKEAQDALVKAGNSFELTVQRGGGATWKPQVTSVGALPSPGSGASPQTVTKTSLAQPPRQSTPVASGHNVSPRPFAGSPQVNGGDQVKAIVNKQYNTPVGMYSEETIAETLSAQAEVLAGGVLGVNFKKNERTYDSQKSEVYKMVHEVELEPRDPEPAPMSNTKYFSTISHAVGGRATSPRPLTPLAQKMGVPTCPMDLPREKPCLPQQSLPQQSLPQQPPPQQPLPQQPLSQADLPQEGSLPPSGPVAAPSQENPQCSDCGRSIVGVFVRIKDKNLHVECFKCATCGTSLKNVGYYSINCKLYCDIHAKMVARQNPPAPNMDPIAIPPGGRIPSGALPSSGLNLGSPAPQSPQPGTLGPLPFHTPTSGVPKPFCAPPPVQSQTYAPVNIPPPAPASVPAKPPTQPPAPAPIADHGHTVVWPPLPKVQQLPAPPLNNSNSKKISERKNTIDLRAENLVTLKDEDVQDTPNGINGKKRMSLCSEEVCNLSENKFQKTDICEAICETYEGHIRPMSPVPDKQMAISKVCKMATMAASKTSYSTEKTVTDTLMTSKSSAQQISSEIRSFTPDISKQSAQLLDLSSKPHEIKSLLPPASLVRPLSPAQVVVFPPELPPDLPFTKSRTCTPQPSMPFPHDEHKEIQSHKIHENFEDSVVKESIDSKIVESCDAKLFTKSEVEKIVKEELDKILKNKTIVKKVVEKAVTLSDLPEPIMPSGAMASALSTASNRPFSPVPPPKAVMGPPPPSPPAQVPNKPVPLPPETEPYFPPPPPPPEQESGSDRVSRAIREVGCRSPLTDALTVASERPYSPLPSVTVLPSSGSTFQPILSDQQVSSGSRFKKPISMLSALTVAPDIPFTVPGQTPIPTFQNEKLDLPLNLPATTTIPVTVGHGAFKPITSSSSTSIIPKPMPPSDENNIQTSRLTPKYFPTVTYIPQVKKEKITLVDRPVSDKAQSHKQDLQKKVTKTDITTSETHVTTKSSSSGLQSPSLIPYYQQHIKEIPACNHAVSPDLNTVKATVKTPPPKSVSAPEKTSSLQQKTSQVKSTKAIFEQSAASQIEELKETKVCTSEGTKIKQIHVSTVAKSPARPKTSNQPPFGRQSPSLLPYYQENIGEIPVRNRSISPVPHLIRAPMINPPPPTRSTPPPAKRTSQQPPSQVGYQKQIKTKAQAVSQIKSSIKVPPTLGYQPSPLAISQSGGKVCNINISKQTFKPEVTVQQSSIKEIHKSVTKEVHERSLSPCSWNAKIRTVQNLSPIEVRLPSPLPHSTHPKPVNVTSSVTSANEIVRPSPKMSVPSHHGASVTSTPSNKKPQTTPSSLSGVGGVSSSSGGAAGGGAPKGGSVAGSTAPRRGRGVLNHVAPGGRIPVCGHCNNQIRGPFITALGKIWCPDHFLCVNAKCKRPLQDIGFVEESEGLYCEYCFEQYLAPNCTKCSNKIKGDCLNAIGKQFHPECFCCAYCGKLFGNNPFFLEDALPYCEADWNELFTTKCFSCGFPIEAGDRWVEALNNNYHSQCFNCTMCKKNLEGQSFFAKGGRPFCKNHAR